MSKRKPEKNEETIESSEVGAAEDLLGAKVEAPKTDEIVTPIFQLKPVKSKPKRRYRKGSKYDPILDGFIKSDETLVQVSVEGKDANYLRTQLNKRIDARKDTKGIEVSVVNNILYLQKTK